MGGEVISAVNYECDCWSRLCEMLTDQYTSFDDVAEDANRVAELDDDVQRLEAQWLDGGSHPEDIEAGTRVHYHPIRGEPEYRPGTTKQKPWMNVNHFWVVHVALDDGKTIHSAHLQHLRREPEEQRLRARVAELEAEVERLVDIDSEFSLGFAGQHFTVTIATAVRDGLRAQMRTAGIATDAEGDNAITFFETHVTVVPSSKPLVDRVAELQQLLGGALIRLQQLGDTEFKLPDQIGEWIYQAVLDEQTLEVCLLAHGATTHGAILEDQRDLCRCFMVQRVKEGS